MTQLLTIGWKDLRLMFRDKAALILMLAAPLALTLGMGLITGAFSPDQTSSISRLPVVLVNQDGGQLGNALQTLFTSPELADLLDVAVSDDAAAARAAVAADETTAAVIIPAGFTASVIPQDAANVTAAPVVAIEINANPARPIGSGIVQSIVQSFLDQVEAGRIGGQVAIEQLIAAGLVTPTQIPQLAQAISEAQTAQNSESLISLARRDTASTQTLDFNPLLLLAPGMAMVFLMFTVSLGSRSILQERQNGTLGRMLSTATPSSSILAGKIAGVYMIGAAQMLLLILTSTLLFRLNWGDPLAVLALVLAAVAGASGWGLVLAAVAKTPTQAANLGMTMMLLFGVLGGSFFGTMLEGPLATVGKITPNAWATQGFSLLARGGTLADLWPVIAALLVMAAVLLAFAVMLFGRKGFLQR
ncbi:MAG: ABC transporter permease [Caldilineales bacterium]